MSYKNRIATVKRDAEGRLSVACKIPFDLFNPAEMSATHITIYVPEGFAEKGDRLNINLAGPERGYYILGHAGSGPYGEREKGEGPKLANKYRGREIFSKKYDGESIVDLSRDISECFDERFNPAVKEIPEMEDCPGFWDGEFVVSVKWVPTSE